MTALMAFGASIFSLCPVHYSTVLHIIHTKIIEIYSLLILTSFYDLGHIFFIENETELNKKDLVGLSNIAVASGTSTPDFVVKRIAKYLTSI